MSYKRLSPKSLPIPLAILVLLATSAAAPLNAQGEQVFPWWQSLIILLLVVLIVAILIIWNSRQPLEYGDSLSHAQASEQGASEEINKAESISLEPDNLEIIEGIGPKIDSIFREAGISTFAQLAESDPAHLASILRNAGLRLGDPTSWPEQARLAAGGDWQGLQALQDSLKGGRQV